MSVTQLGELHQTTARERRDLAARLLEDCERVSVAELVRRFGVTDVSIRRDLMIREDAGRLRRVHGGAVAATAGREPGAYALKARDNRGQKARIGAAAAALIRPGDIVICQARCDSPQRGSVHV